LSWSRSSPAYNIQEAAKDLTTVNLLMQKQNVSKKSQIITEEAARDLTTVNLLMQKQNISKKSQIITMVTSIFFPIMDSHF
jgi:hypothetical protein